MVNSKTCETCNVKIISKPTTPAYEETWERLEKAGEFGKKEKK